MLVIISDLHFTDGTTSNIVNGQDVSNVNPKAFKRFLENVAAIIKSRGDIKKVTFVYNGDIFDPLRSAQWFEWFDCPRSEQPWSKPYDDPATLTRLNSILENIISHKGNAEALQWLRGTHKDFNTVWPDHVKVERMYIPGNHDRMINLDSSLRKQVYKALLDKEDSSEVFENFILNPDHRALIMHGHEADTFNCEFDESGPIYSAQPIGDAMTTMLFSAISLESQKLTINKAAKIRFRDIEHVRPHLVGISYIQDIIKDFPRSQKAITNMVKRIVDDFQEIDFYKEWIEQHDKWNILPDEADLLQDAFRVIKLLGTHIPSGPIEKLAGLSSASTYVQFAEKKLKAESAQEADFCILGHTHEPRHVPLFVDKHTGKEKHYLNTGTFRANLGRTYDKENFLRFLRMCYVVAYGPDEFAKGSEPVYELWSGLRRST